MSNSGSRVEEELINGTVNIQFEFENFTDDKGNSISTNDMQQWHMESGQTTWIRNSEFKPTESIITWVETLAEYDFGTNAGTTTYYDIPAGVAYPLVYDTNSGWNSVLDNVTYNFGAGKKYTFTCSGDGQYLVFSISVDGTFNAPAQSKIVDQRRILKSDLPSLSRVRK